MSRSIFVKQGSVISRESRSSEKFVHGIQVLMAKNYVDNLSEETRKGMLEKAEQGIWPSFAPLGYLNLDRTIVADPSLAPIIRSIFEWYFGAVEIEVPRDRNGTFEPKLIPKHERRFNGFDGKILSMYARA
jgi:DNA invertase Pin-like site-specific DNA recombinase